MYYLYYILDKLNLANNSIRYSFKKVSPTNEVTGKVKTDIIISNKNIKINFIIYLVMAFFFVFIPYLWFLFFPISIININGTYNPNIKFTLILFIIIFVINISYIFIRNYLMYRSKESKPINVNIYNRELPANLTPAHARLLVLDGVIDAKTIVSTILDLIDRGYLKLEIGNREDLFKKNLLISKTNKEKEDLFEYENYLINWLFSEEKTTSLTLHKKLNDINNNPYENFSIFQGLVLLSFPLNKYYKNNNNSKKTYMNCATIFCISLMIFVFNIFIKSILLLGISEFFVLFELINILFIPPSYLLNDEGVEVRDSFLDLSRYLTDFSLIKEKSSEMIVLWNYYLSYSVALGIDSIANKEINDFFGSNIYNLNNQELFSEEKIQTLINNVPSEIEKSKELYQKRNINW